MKQEKVHHHSYQQSPTNSSTGQVWLTLESLEAEQKHLQILLIHFAKNEASWKQDSNNEQIPNRELNFSGMCISHTTLIRFSCLILPRPIHLGTFLFKMSSKVFLCNIQTAVFDFDLDNNKKLTPIPGNW